ncbi:PAS domain S-box protein [Actinacidiphila glaucinigra]|uniref:PAS domain S-box protein n=1 Tax=Actinacidiphila glaucinigra TaxID=235986 RepID=UPI0038029933
MSTTETATSEAHEAPAPGGAATALLDAEGTVAGWSQAAERPVGYSAAEVLGRPAGAMLLDGGVPQARDSRETRKRRRRRPGPRGPRTAG